MSDMTPEERAVIEAAEQQEEHSLERATREGSDFSQTTYVIATAKTNEAVRHLHASRQPKGPLAVAKDALRQIVLEGCSRKTAEDALRAIAALERDHTNG